MKIGDIVIINSKNSAYDGKLAEVVEIHSRLSTARLKVDGCHLLMRFGFSEFFA